MPEYTLVASDLISAVTTEGQAATTNRTLLLDYLNRVHQRILRESQWAFLKSERQRFITVPGVQKYWVGSSANKPLRYVDTGLNLVDFDNLLLDSVEDESYGHSLSFDASKLLNSVGNRRADGNDVGGLIRSFAVSYDNPGAVTLHPVPTDTNQYTPVPLAPVVTIAPAGFLPPRMLFVTCTLVDTNGGESTPCDEPTIISIPTGQLATVEPPPLEIGTGIGVLYTRWNLYVGTSPLNMTLQNATPLGRDISFVEPITGFTQYTYPSYVIAADPTYYISITDAGLLQQTVQSTYIANGLILRDSSGVRWQFTKDSNGIMSNMAVPNTAVTPSLPYLYLQSPAGNIWQVGVNTSGLLTSTAAGTIFNWTVPGMLPPGSSTIIPMNGCIISFRYNKKRKQLSMSDTLQVPSIYRDVVLAGLNYYATSYLKSDPADNTASRWYQEFNMGLGQIRKDLRLSTKTTDIILPDAASQMNSSFIGDCRR